MQWLFIPQISNAISYACITEHPTLDVLCWMHSIPRVFGNVVQIFSTIIACECIFYARKNRSKFNIMAIECLYWSQIAHTFIRNTLIHVQVKFEKKHIWISAFLRHFGGLVVSSAFGSCLNFSLHAMSFGLKLFCFDSQLGRPPHQPHDLDWIQVGTS